MVESIKKGMYTIVNLHLLPWCAQLVNSRVKIFSIVKKAMHYCISSSKKNSVIYDTKIEIEWTLIRMTKLLTESENIFLRMNSDDRENIQRGHPNNEHPIVTVIYTM